MVNSIFSFFITPLSLASLTAAQGWSGSNWGQSGGLGPSCLSNCWSDIGTSDWTNGLSSLCGNATAVNAINSCISGSSCDNSDKEGTYQVLAQICANSGHALSASPEASFHATSGGSAYPTSSGAWSSYASAFATITGAPGASSGGWGPGGGYGPFGTGAPNSGYGPWGSSNSGSEAWTNGPWTNWWGSAACPPSTWTGWTSGPWGTNAPWTSWTSCTEKTTGSSVVTTTVTTGGSTKVMTTTAYGLQVAEASSTGSAVSASATGSSGERRVVVSIGAGLACFIAAIGLM